jgi:hypothetical protein
MATYLVGKIGKSVKFNPRTWGPIGGDNEAPELLRKMAQLNPKDTFVIIGRNDVDKHRQELGLPDNLVDVYQGCTKEERKDVNYIGRALADKQIDGCFLLTGPTANCNIPNKSYKRNDLKKGEKNFAKSLETFQNYVAPIYQYLNESNIPWIMIANDPRYIRQGNDLMNQPQMILSQYDETIMMQTFDNWEDQNYVQNNIPSVYAGMEKIFLIDKTIQRKEKHTNFMMVLNQGEPSRYPFLKEYVLDHMEDVKIYGKWDDDIIENDSRFKGPKKFEELQAELPHVKYTFIIPIKKGWVTAKWVEMIANGIIPFFHPTYDEQKHCNVPDYIRINNPKELGEKIEELNSNPDLYNKILSECLNCIKDEDISGEYISKIILSQTPAINKTGNVFQIIKEKEEGLDDW